MWVLWVASSSARSQGSRICSISASAMPPEDGGGAVVLFQPSYSTTIGARSRSLSAASSSAVHLPPSSFTPLHSLFEFSPLSQPSKPFSSSRRRTQGVTGQGGG